MFELQISAKAKRQLKQISQVYQQQAISEALAGIREDPLIGKPLVRELSKKFSIKVSQYRIIYIINIQDRIVTIISAGHRNKIYG